MLYKPIHIIPMEKKQSVLQFAMTYGAILGIILVVISILMYVMNIVPDKAGKAVLLSLFNLLVVVIFVIISMRSYRDKVMNGFIPYWNAFTVGLMVVVFAAVITSFYALIFNTLIDPGYTERVYEALKNNMYDMYTNMGLTESQIDRAMSRIESQQANYTPLNAFYTGILGSAFMGSVVSLIIAAFVKKNPTPFENAGS